MNRPIVLWTILLLFGSVSYAETFEEKLKAFQALLNNDPTFDAVNKSFLDLGIDDTNRQTVQAIVEPLAYQSDSRKGAIQALALFADFEYFERIKNDHSLQNEIF